MIIYATKKKIFKDRKGQTKYKKIMKLFLKHKKLTTSEINCYVEIENVKACIQYINNHKNMTITRKKGTAHNGKGGSKVIWWWELEQDNLKEVA